MSGGCEVEFDGQSAPKIGNPITLLSRLLRCGPMWNPSRPSMVRGEDPETRRVKDHERRTTFRYEMIRKSIDTLLEHYIESLNKIHMIPNTTDTDTKILQPNNSSNYEFRRKYFRGHATWLGCEGDELRCGEALREVDTLRDGNLNDNDIAGLERIRDGTTIVGIEFGVELVASKGISAI